MADRHSSSARSHNMRAVKSKNTKPELMIRHALHALGFRYALHRKDLPGKPDLVFPKYQAVIFINGCFWHGHDCSAFSWPKTREEFWREKISTNMVRDLINCRDLHDLGWRVATIWECSLKGKSKPDFEGVISTASTWLKSDKSELQVGYKRL